ncbi:hypothetical protein KC357_g9308, partial [Hortaea werneckii]
YEQFAGEQAAFQFMYHSTNEVTLDAFGIPCARISAGLSAKERAEIVEKFNDPDSDEIMVVIASSRSAAESINLQKGCHYIFILDVVHFNIIAQIIGRVFRIGQRFQQFIKILTLNRTYDQVLLSQYCSSIVAQLAATSGAMYDIITQDMVDEQLASEDFKQSCLTYINYTGRTLDAQAREHIYNDMVCEKLRLNFGLRSNRDNDYWSNAKGMDRKLDLPEERDFFLDAGGRCAERTRAYLRAQEEAKREAAGQVSPPKRHPQSTKRTKGVASHEDFLSKQERFRERYGNRGGHDQGPPRKKGKHAVVDDDEDMEIGGRDDETEEKHDAAHDPLQTPVKDTSGGPVVDTPMGDADESGLGQGQFDSDHPFRDLPSPSKFMLSDEQAAEQLRLLAQAPAAQD